MCNYSSFLSADLTLSNHTTRLMFHAFGWPNILLSFILKALVSFVNSDIQCPCFSIVSDELSESRSGSVKDIRASIHQPLNLHLFLLRKTDSPETQCHINLPAG